MIVVVGGINIDIIGKSSNPLVLETSNIGNVTHTLGGVSRNIAHNLAKLGIPVTLLGVVGNDSYGEKVILETNSAGVNTEHILHTSNHNTGTYLAILSNSGELSSAIASMNILDCITIDYLKSKLSVIKNASYIVCDTNIPEQSIEYLVHISNTFSIPICVEPVSVPKSKKIKNILNGISLITPNRDELSAISDCDISDDISQSCEILLKKGVSNILITLGQKGVLFVSKNINMSFNSIKTNVVDVTGAGDSLISGVLYGLYLKNDIVTSIKYGLCAASITISSKNTVSENLNANSIQKVFENNFK